MKRFLRRFLGAVAGLALGWIIAGMVSAEPSSLSQPAGTPAPTTQGEGSLPVAATPVAPGEGMKMLVPQAGQTSWLVPVLCGAGSLFVVAIGVGLANRALMIKDPADQAAERHG